ncbi:MAG: hypothetical protein ACLSDQ_13005 [Adlercreutzia equolifaciens]
MDVAEDRSPTRSIGRPRSRAFPPSASPAWARSTEVLVAEPAGGNDKMTTLTLLTCAAAVSGLQAKGKAGTGVLTGQSATATPRHLARHDAEDGCRRI